MLLNATRMSWLPRLLSALLALTYFTQKVLADGTLSLQLLAYENPDGDDADGGSCDILTSDCDPYFLICVSPVDPGGDCSILNARTGVYRDSNNVNFGSTLGNSIPNPIVLTFSEWPSSGLEIIVSVWDEDSRSSHDFIDTLTATIGSTPDRSADAATTRDVTVKGRTNLFGRLIAYCNDGWYGNTCVTYCVPHNDVINGYYTCSDTGERVCETGYEGENCTDNTDDCASVPCQNAGRCTDLRSGFYCSCSAGYTGVTCEIDIDECESEPCSNNGTCIDGVHGFFCACVEGFTGVTCDDVVDYCAVWVCLNGAQCIQEAASAQCQCTPGFTGDQCETDIDECAETPCVGDGSVCADLVNTFTCTCESGRTGLTCEDIIYPETTARDDVVTTAQDPCLNSPCVMGSCERSGPAAFTCHCPPSFSGPLCAVDACSGTPCGDNATCRHDEGTAGYTCLCADGTTGLWCNSSGLCTCLNGGSCKEGSDICICPDTWTGRRCEQHIVNHCELQTCSDKGTCESLATGFRCRCQPGYTGEVCDVTSSTCRDSPCQHGGTCHDDFQGYHCTCSVHYEGEHCEKFSHEEDTTGLTQVFLFVGTLDDYAISNLEMSIISLVSEHSAKPAHAYRMTHELHHCQGTNGTKVSVYTFQVLDELNDVVPWFTLDQIFSELSQQEFQEILPRPLYTGADCSGGAQVDASKTPHPTQLWPIVVGVVALALVVGIIVAVVIAYKRKRRSGGFEVVTNPLFEDHQTRRGTTETQLSIGSDEQSNHDIGTQPVYFRSYSQEYPVETGSN